MWAAHGGGHQREARYFTEGAKHLLALTLALQQAKRVEQRVSIKQLASALGLSTSTVSRALNGYTDVNEQTRERVQAMADAMGYRFALVSKRAKPGRKVGKRTVAPAAPIGAGKRRVAQVKQG